MGEKVEAEPVLAGQAMGLAGRDATATAASSMTVQAADAGRTVAEVALEAGTEAVVQKVVDQAFESGGEPRNA